MKKITSLFLALLMICYGVFTVPVLAADNNENPEPSNGSESTETLPSFSSVNSAVSFIRSEMTSRVEEFQFVYTGKTKLTAETIFAYSGSEADEGDYLKFNLSDFLLIPEGEVISCSAAYHTDAQQEEAIDAKVNEIVGSVDAAGMTDYQKAVFVYDYLCDNVEYLDDANSISVYTAYGALCGGKAVCQGYALAYYRMARALGLNCRMIVGSLSEEGNEVPHAWNAVKLGDSWYYVDTTNGAGAQSDEPHDRYVCFMAPLDNGIYQLNIAFEEEDQSEEDGSAEIDEADILTSAEIAKYSFNQPLTGECGEGLQWELDPAMKHLVITGSGEMSAFPADDLRWRNYKEIIFTVRIDDEVAAICEDCFTGCSADVHVMAGSAAQAYMESHLSEGMEYHILTPTDYVAPTCQAVGYTEGLYCDVCGIYYTGHQAEQIQPHADGDSDGLCDTCGLDMNFTDNGVCGVAIQWYFYAADGQLALRGSGEMRDYSSSGSNVAPWKVDYSNSIRNIGIGEGITSIGSHAFEKLTSLSEITLPNSVTEIGSYAFFNCKTLNKITLPNRLEAIGTLAFAHTALSNIAIPKTLKKTAKSSYGYGIFYDSKLEIISFENGMTVIPDAVCKDAASLKYVEFPDTVKVIGNSAFYNCTALGSAPVEITLPENLETIRAAAFINTAISAITIPKTLKTTNMTIGNSGVFSDSKLNSIRFTEGMTKIPAGICKGAALLSSVEIPSSVTSIGSKAFANCEALKEIKFPDNLTEIGAAAFANTSITSVVIPKTVQKTSGTLGMSGIFSDSCLQSIQFEDGTACVPSYICSGAKQLTTVVIPQSVTSIGKYAFYQCGALTSLALPNMLADIGNNAFSGCTSLSVINWPETLSYIGKAAFAGTSITYAFIPAKVDRVRADTFMDCAAFCSVVILSDKIVLESTAFKNHPDNLEIHCNPDSSAFRFAENNQISCHSNIEIGNELKQLCTGEKEICILAHCNDCNKMFTSADILNAVGHVVVVDHEVPATCLETGLSEGSHCSVCGTVLVAQTEIPAAGHKPEEMPAVAPTCGTVGYTAGIKCGVCEEILDEPQAIPATGEHTPIAIPAEPATCTKNGRTEGTKCGVCGAVLIAPEAIPKTGHTVVIDAAVEATCTQDGLTEGSHCSVCGKTLTSQKTIPETGHQDTTREGERADGVCDICGERLEENFFQRIIHRIGRFFEGLSSFFKHLFSRGQRKKINTIS